RQWKAEYKVDEKDRSGLSSNGQPAQAYERIQLQPAMRQPQVVIDRFEHSWFRRSHQCTVVAGKLSPRQSWNTACAQSSRVLASGEYPVLAANRLAAPGELRRSRWAPLEQHMEHAAPERQVSCSISLISISVGSVVRRDYGSADPGGTKHDDRHQ